jgi:hypothetical protein
VVAAHHRELSAPHLGLSADNVMLRAIGGGRSMAPARWCFEAALVDVGSSQRRVLAGLGQLDGAAALCLPGTDAGRAYLAPQLDPALMSFALPMQVTAGRLGDGDAGPGLRLELRSARERLDRVRPGDVVRVQPDGGLPGTGEQPLLARVTAVKRDHVIAEVRLEPASTAALPAAPFPFAALATFHRRLQTPSDLFALGMLLARALLVHDERDVFAVRELWDRVLDKLEMMLGGAKAPEPERIATTLRSLLDAERGHLSSNAVLWPKALRAAVQEPVPAVPWREALLLIGRLLTNHDGFSFAAHHGDVPAAAPDAPLRQVLQAGEELLAALQLELNEQAPRAEELANIANELVREVNAAMVGKTRGAE